MPTAGVREFVCGAPSNRALEACGTLASRLRDRPLQRGQSAGVKVCRHRVHRPEWRGHQCSIEEAATAKFLSTQMATPFTHEVRALAAEKDDGFVNSAHRTYLRQLAADPDLEDIWKGIEKKCGKRSKLEMRLFIRDIASSRSLANSVDEWPDYLAHAKNTERVIRFLKGSGRRPPPLPRFTNPTFIALLEDMALYSRQRGNHIHISRETTNNRRQYLVVIQLLNLAMKEYFGRWLDNEVADLTSIFFPKASITLDSVRAARRRKSRRRNPLGGD